MIHVAPEALTRAVELYLDGRHATRFYVGGTLVPKDGDERRAVEASVVKLVQGVLDECEQPEPEDHDGFAPVRWPVGPHYSRAALDVLAERRRQVVVEGHTPEHDLTHAAGDLAAAGAAYATPPDRRLQWPDGTPVVWPWAEGEFKPTNGDRRRELVKAAALVLAEIERMDRG